MRTEGFDEILKQKGPHYNHYRDVAKENEDRYNVYREGYENQYYDTKESHEYYTQPLSTRMRVQAKPAMKQMVKDIFETKDENDKEGDHVRPAC